MAIISVGVDHEHAPLEVLEAVTVPEPEWAKVLHALAALDDVDEVVVVSTCLRTEAYAVVERFHGAVDGITGVLAARAAIEPEVLAAHATVHFDRGVPAHLFAVAAGLRSSVPGETEVLGQVRRSLERAIDEGSAGPELTELFRRALAAGRAARARTGISRGTTSFAHATVAMAAARLGTLQGTRVVVVGAGQLASGVVDGLVEGRRGRPSAVAIANRTVAAAASLAARDPALCTAASLDDLGGFVAAADLVICAVEADHPIVTSAMLERRGAPVLVVDLGMPRTVAHDATEIDGVTLLDIAHLHDVVDAALSDRRDELDAAEAVVAAEVARHLEDRRARGAAPLVTELRARLEQLRAAELERAASELSTLSDDERDRVDQLTRSIVAKIAHDPTIALRESAGTDRGQRLAEAARTLFDL